MISDSDLGTLGETLGRKAFSAPDYCLTTLESLSKVVCWCSAKVAHLTKKLTMLTFTLGSEILNCPQIFQSSPNPSPELGGDRHDFCSLAWAEGPSATNM